MTEADYVREMTAAFCRNFGGTFQISDDREELGGNAAIYYYPPEGGGYAAVAWTTVQALEELARKLEGTQ